MPLLPIGRSAEGLNTPGKFPGNAQVFSVNHVGKPPKSQNVFLTFANVELKVLLIVFVSITILKADKKVELGSKRRYGLVVPVPAHFRRVLW